MSATAASAAHTPGWRCEAQCLAPPPAERRARVPTPGRHRRRGSTGRRHAAHPAGRLCQHARSREPRRMDERRRLPQ
ncbi:MAG: hypothetical protein CVT64_10765 [Actinobacteria bacterium HGW-Actinobacteria-4]|nr:MAG: hypothetical protein CVT64_10765 [Actinobacteria bacterium HGW-Actinobacteria-4]